ncbi:MAG: fumarate hydratase [Desulfovibrio sp.]
MRIISAQEVIDTVAEMCISGNTGLPDDVRRAMETAMAEENSDAAKEIFRQLLENDDLSRESKLPLCQDTGLAVFFIELGEECRVEGGLNVAINEGVRKGYEDGFLRKSTCDPFSRKNVGDNTPAIIHTDLVPGDKLTISYMAKGGGAENMSRVTMLAPAQGWEGIRKFVLNRVIEAGPNPCPPISIGIGIGGTYEEAAKISKKALMRKMDDVHPDAEIAKLEKELLEEVNSLGIGPMGLGGKTTCLALKMAVMPCHLASLPLAINIQCHSSRHNKVVL